MQVHIKNFNVDMEVKSSGVEFEVRTPDGSSQHGDCFLTMTGLTWCKGKIARANGVKIGWADFMLIAASDASVKAAVTAAKKA